VIPVLLIGTAFSASLDLLDVGGVYGTPNSNGGTAAWWNPAGFATGEGLQVHIEAAPTFGGVRYERSDPMGGQDEYRTAAVIPFAGVTHGLNQEKFGIGGAVGIPIGRGGASIYEQGAGRYHMRSGGSQAIYGMVGAAWRPVDQIAVGGVISVVHSRWDAYLDSETLPDLESAIQALGEQTVYTDADLEDPHYASTLETQGSLTDTRMSFAIGVKVMPDPEGRVSLSATYHHGVTLEHTGDARILIGCPPQEDTIGRFGSESYGLCNDLLEADMSVSYRLPARIHGGVLIMPIEALRIELMGGWVNWSVYDDFTVEISGIEEKNPDVNPEAAELVSKHQLWARDAQDSIWGALDIKGTLAQGWVTVGGRALFDRASIPDHAVSPNNFDANSVTVSGMAALHILPVDLDLYVSYSEAFLQERTVTNSAYSVSLGDDRAEERWYYPHANGSYSAWTRRVALGLRWRF
jgi:long-subunit fatty acid transport protein